MNRYTKDRMTAGKHALTEGQVKKLINNCPHLEEATLLSLGVSTGMRRFDIVRVLVDDVDLEENKVAYKEKKKGNRIRVVGLPQSTSTKIKRWLNVRDSSSKYLFPARQSNSETGHISGRTAYNIFQRNLERNSLDKRPFHSLRATCVKLCQRKGWTPEQTAEHIGDKIETVRKHYSTPSDEEMFKVSKEKSLL